ncbi:MAG: hypothetical protein HY646_20075 [Acidobacteria bacterium]|nr:hypothetical protein [Acidobacteriota bacterium]
MVSWLAWNVESALILYTFDFLLAGIGFLVATNEIRNRNAQPQSRPEVVAFGFALLALHFAILTGLSALAFFYHLRFNYYSAFSIDSFVFSMGLAAMAIGLARASFRWLIGVAVVWVASLPLALVATDLTGPLISLVIVGLSAIAFRCSLPRLQYLFIAAWGLLLVTHVLNLFGVATWDVNRMATTAAMLLFVLGAGERSTDPLARVFVRLNISFILLAALIIVVITQTEKVEYLKLAEQRGLNLAEVIRGHVLYQDSLQSPIERSINNEDILRKIVTEFGHLQELRRVAIRTPATEVSFEIQASGEITQTEKPVAVHSTNDPDHFRIISLPMDIREGRGYVELWGTIEYINSYIGRHMVLIFSLFTGVVILSSVLVGLVTYDASRTIENQYAELQRTHLELMHAAKLASIGELAGGVAHEINNPTTTILSRASFLLRKANRRNVSVTEIEDLSAIVEAGERISRITTRLLTFSRRERLEVAPFSIRDAIDDAIVLAEVSRPPNVHVKNEVNGDLPPVLGNRDRMTEVFLNMAVNAFQAMPEGGHLGFSAGGINQNMLEVQVSDTGVGIRETDVERIFDPFFTTKEPGRGTGLGLAISYAIVRDHGGRIDVRSRLGAGTAFLIRLPVGAEEEQL